MTNHLDLDQRCKLKAHLQSMTKGQSLLPHVGSKLVLMKVLRKIGQDPSVYESNKLHVYIKFSIFHYYNLKTKFQINSSRMIDNLPKILNLNMLLLKLNWHMCN